MTKFLLGVPKCWFCLTILFLTPVFDTPPPPARTTSSSRVNPTQKMGKPVVYEKFDMRYEAKNAKGGCEGADVY